MTFTDIVFASALGQLAALGIAAFAWLLWQVSKLIWTFGVAASQTRVAIIAQRKKG